MRAAVTAALIVLHAVAAMATTRITREYVREPLSSVLVDIDKAAEEIEISFIYNKLEDYLVTCSLNNATPMEAIQQAVGFYPVRVSQNGDRVTIEPIFDIDRKLSGRVTTADGQPLEYANIALYSLADGHLIVGGVATASGDFVIPCDEERVRLRASFIGYKSEERECEVGDVGTISLSEDAIQLAEIRKTGARPIVRAEHGALSYDMPTLLSIMPADNAYEAITRIPGVSETNGEIEFAGQRITLIINGKASTLSAEQLKERLRQMPAERLARCELMMSAPARFHARGAVINIVTKDNYGRQQLSGQLLGAGVFGKRSYGYGAGSLLWAQGRFTLEADYNASAGQQYKKVERHDVHPLATGPQRYDERNETTSDFISHYYRVGMEYAFAQDKRLELVYNGKWSRSAGDVSATGSTVSRQHSVTHNYMNNVDLSYTQSRNLQLGVSYMRYEFPQQQDLNAVLLGTRRDYLAQSDQTVDKLAFNIDKEHHFAHDWSLSYGWLTKITQHRSWQNTTLPSGETVEAATSKSNFTERIHKLYTSVGKDWGKHLSAELGLECEAYSLTDDDAFASFRSSDKPRLLPSLNIMWRPNGRHTLSLSTSSAADYPRYYSMISNIYYTSAYDEIWGNPELRPMHCYNNSLLWQIDQRYTFSAAFNYNDGFFTQMPYQPSDRLAVIMQEVNLKYRINGYLTASAQWHIGDWANGNAGAVLIYTHDKGDRHYFHELDFDRENLSGRLSATVVLRPFKRSEALRRLTLTLQPVYQFAAIQGVYDIKPFFELDASLRWTSPSGRLSASLHGINLSNTGMESSVRAYNQNFRMAMWMNPRCAQLTLIYRVGNFKEKRHKQVDTSRMGH